MSEATKEAAAFDHALRDVRDWLDLKMRTGRYVSGFAMELAAHMIARHYSVQAIYDEIGILEGADARPSTTKPATPFVRPPLVGLWHKHHHQAQFLPKNLLQELHRPGTVEAACAPHIGRTVEEAAGAIAYELVIGAYTRRAAENRVTGEFIVYEPGQSHTLTNGVAALDLAAVDVDGTVRRGRISRGDNLVCVTFELLVIGLGEGRCA